MIDEQGRVTQYVYDPAGNILQVIGAGAGAAQTPTVASITPATIRRNRVKTIQVTGSGLQGVRVSVADPGIDISNLSVSPTALSFNLAASRATALGNHTITFTNASGSAQATITVAPQISYLVTPNPLTLPPDNVARQFTIVASEVDTEPITFAVSTLNQAVARAGTAPIAFAAGQAQATGTITGVAVGSTALILNSPSLVDTMDAVIWVSADHASANVAYSKPLGVVRGNPADPAVNSASGPLLSAPLGVVKGNPADPALNSASGPLLSAPLGVVKGNPADPAVNSASGPLLSAPLGVVKGNPADPAVNSASGPLLSPPVGVIVP